MEKAVETICRLQKNLWHLNDKHSVCFGQQEHTAHTIKTNLM